MRRPLRPRRKSTTELSRFSFAWTRSASFVLAAASLKTTVGAGPIQTVILSTIETANLTGSATASNTFDTGGWTLGGSLTGGSATDALTATSNANFKLSNTALGALGLAVFAFAGALAAGIVVYLVASTAGGLPVHSLLLAGVIVGIFFSAAITVLI